jgi:hypothetical protein
MFLYRDTVGAMPSVATDTLNGVGDDWTWCLATLSREKPCFRLFRLAKFVKLQRIYQPPCYISLLLDRRFGALLAHECQRS